VKGGKPIDALHKRVLKLLQYFVCLLSPSNDAFLFFLQLRSASFLIRFFQVATSMASTRTLDRWPHLGMQLGVALVLVSSWGEKEMTLSITAGPVPERFMLERLL